MNTLSTINISTEWQTNPFLKPRRLKRRFIESLKKQQCQHLGWNSRNMLGFSHYRTQFLPKEDRTHPSQTTATNTQHEGRIGQRKTNIHVLSQSNLNMQTHGKINQLYHSSGVQQVNRIPSNVQNGAHSIPNSKPIAQRSSPQVLHSQTTPIPSHSKPIIPKSHSLDGVDHLTQPIYLLDPNKDEEHTLLLSVHKTPPHLLLWSPSNLNDLFLSLDSENTLCIWEMQQFCVNDYHCTSSWELDHVVSVKWIDTNRKVYLQNSNAKPTDDIFSKYPLKNSRLNKIPRNDQMFFVIEETGRISMFCLNHWTNEWDICSMKLPCQVAKADCIITQDSEGILVAVTSSWAIPEMSFFHVKFSRSATSEKFQLTAIPGFNPITIDREGSFSHEYISHLIFPPLSGGQEILICKVIENCDNVESCSISKYRIRNQPIHKSQTGITKEILSLHQKVTISNRDCPTSIQYSQDGTLLIIGYSSGKCEIRNSEDLKICTEYYSLGTQKDESFIIGTAISPNNCLAAILDSQFTIHLLCLFNPQQISQIPRQIEVAMLNYCDLWDILCVIRHFLNDKSRSTDIQTMITEYHKLRLDRKKDIERFYIFYERTYSILLSLLGGRHRVDSVYLQSVITLRYVYSNVVSENVMIPTMQSLLTAFSEVSLSEHEYSIIFPLTSWVCRFIMFLFVNCQQYVINFRHSNQKDPRTLYQGVLNVEFLKQIPNLDLLKKLTLYAYAVACNQPKFSKESSFHPTKDRVEILYQFVDHLSKLAPSFKESSDYLYQSQGVSQIEQILAKHSQISSWFGAGLLRIQLDIVPQLRGLIHVNDSFSLDEKDLLLQQHLYDVVSKKRLRSNKPYRICRICSRVSSPTDKKNSYYVSCPLCGGNFVLKVPRE